MEFKEEKDKSGKKFLKPNFEKDNKGNITCFSPNFTIKPKFNNQ